VSLAATRSLGAHRQFSAEQIQLGLPEMPLQGTALEQLCPPNAIAECVPGKVNLLNINIMYPIIVGVFFSIDHIPAIATMCANHFGVLPMSHWHA
jgi:hypothetical protein